MKPFPDQSAPSDDPLLSIRVSNEVIAYIQKKKTDFRISTSCGGPILLPVSYKPPKKSDIRLKAGEYVIYVSVHQVRYMSEIHMGMVPFHSDGSFCS